MGTNFLTKNDPKLSRMFGPLWVVKSPAKLPSNLLQDFLAETKTIHQRASAPLQGQEPFRAAPLQDETARKSFELQNKGRLQSFYHSRCQAQIGNFPSPLRICRRTKNNFCSDCHLECTNFRKAPDTFETV